MNKSLWFFSVVALIVFPMRALALDADCYDQGEDYFIPATDLLEAKKKALLCFFAEISFRTSVKEGNKDIDFQQETNMEAKSTLIDWQGLRKASTPNLYRWSIRDVNANLKALSQANEKKIIPVTKEVQEVWHSNQIKKDIIELVSTPSGATVTFDGLESACQTPCKLEVIHGVHTVSLWKADFSRLSGTIRVDGARVTFPFELKENISRIGYEGCPEGTNILVDGNRLGITSNGQMKMAPGTYILEFEHPEYFKSNQSVTVKVGETMTVQCSMKAKMGGIEISTRNSKGDPVKATVEIDGQMMGKTPGVFDVRAGARRVKLLSDDEGWEDTVYVEKSNVTHISKSLIPLESDAEKQRKATMRAFSFMAIIGQMSDQKLVERKTNRIFEFKQCGSADPDKGSALRLRLSKNLSDNFGLNLGMISGQYEVCNSSYDSKSYQEIVNRYQVEYQGLTAGLHYTLFTDVQTESSTSLPTYRRWLTMSLSSIRGIDFTVRNKETNNESRVKSSSRILAELSLVEMIAGHFRLSVLELAAIQDTSLEPSSPVEISSLSMLYIIGLGVVF